MANKCSAESRESADIIYLNRVQWMTNHNGAWPSKAPGNEVFDGWRWFLGHGGGGLVSCNNNSIQQKQQPLSAGPPTTRQEVFWHTDTFYRTRGSTTDNISGIIARCHIEFYRCSIMWLLHSVQQKHKRYYVKYWMWFHSNLFSMYR